MIGCDYFTHSLQLALVRRSCAHLISRISCAMAHLVDKVAKHFFTGFQPLAIDRSLWKGLHLRHRGIPKRGGETEYIGIVPPNPTLEHA